MGTTRGWEGRKERERDGVSERERATNYETKKNQRKKPGVCRKSESSWRYFMLLLCHVKANTPKVCPWKCFPFLSFFLSVSRSLSFSMSSVLSFSLSCVLFFFLLRIECPFLKQRGGGQDAKYCTSTASGPSLKREISHKYENVSWLKSLESFLRFSHVYSVLSASYALTHYSARPQLRS